MVLNILDMYSLLVAIISTLFGMFSLILAYIGYVKFKQVDKVVQKRLNEEMDKFVNSLQDQLYNLQSANAKIQSSYNYFSSDIDKAVALLADAREICPKAYNLYNALGYAYKEKKDYNTAKIMFDRAIELHPDRIEGYNDMANLCKDLNDEKGYNYFYELAIKNVPSAAEKWALIKK